jgi:hypothetical protein
MVLASEVASASPGHGHRAGRMERCQNLLVAEEQLDGGNIDGAVRVGDTVRRAAGPWTPAVHALLAHLVAKAFPGAPRPLGGALAGFFDWDFAGPVTPEWDLAFAAFSWVPLHARHVVAAEGFTDFAARSRRLHRFLRAYGWSATGAEFLEEVQERVKAHADGVRDLAAAGDEVFERLLRQGVADDLDQAIAELATFPR